MIYRIELRTRPSVPGEPDPAGETLRRQIAEFDGDVGPIQTRRIFLIDTDADRPAIARVAAQLLADPIADAADVFTVASELSDVCRIEVHLKPGVMDPVAASTEMAIRDLGVSVRQVRTGRAYLFQSEIDRSRRERIAARVLANGVIESVHFDPYLPSEFETGHLYRFQLRHVPLRQLTDAQLTALSREAHLFLSLTEMKAIQAYYREQSREPTDVELETIAQTWSEHCVHKTLKSAVDVEVMDQNGKLVETRRYRNLIKETIFGSTQKLMESPGNFCLSVFSDNAGIIVFDDTDAVCFKAETHNHPSAIEPYGGSATGIGGVIRDILGTGLGAKPIANTDVFCVAFPDAPAPLPRGIIHPKRILQQVVAGVRDYGNRMGIPTVNGAVYFDDRYLGNPLVFCGCVGLIPRDKIVKAAQVGDAVVLVGGRTGRDGIHGATFSSAELTDTHADEFSHAVQIGNAITEKKMADVILAARDRGLFTAITDCGAGGLSSAVGEMGEKIGADISLEKVPLKYAGLAYDEIWISEAQERMVLSVPKEKLAELLDHAAAEDVEATVIGHFGTESRQLILRYHDSEVARLSMEFLHDGIPMPTRRAVCVMAIRGTGVPPVSAASELAKPAATHSPNNQHGQDAHATRGTDVPPVSAAPELATPAATHPPSNQHGQDARATRGTDVPPVSAASEYATPATTQSLSNQHGQDARATRGTDVPPVSAAPELATPAATHPPSNQHGQDARATTHSPSNQSRRAGTHATLLKKLAHPNIASKHWIIRQYDHEVQGGSVIKPLTGPRQIGPSDAAVIRPKLDSHRGIAIGCGLCPQIPDPYEMALAAIDEAVRNVIAVGADPDRLAMLDNFCWPSVDDEVTMGTLVRACEACRDAALAYRIPFISGKDSLHNQFTNRETGQVIRIPSTLLISTIGIVEDVRRCITMDLKTPGNHLAIVSPTGNDLPARVALHRAVAAAIANGWIVSCHDSSDGGPAVAAAEMCIASGLGLDLRFDNNDDLFREQPTTYLIEYTPSAAKNLEHLLPNLLPRGEVRPDLRLRLTIGNQITDIAIDDMTKAWRCTLDW
jgi:phosphoribosylformylglycinamidine (FGAM) synthase-like enzyme/phosphoribosylformylglycinamidine (FGAM) synthase PurS component